VANHAEILQHFKQMDPRNQSADSIVMVDTLISYHFN